MYNSHQKKKYQQQRNKTPKKKKRNHVPYAAGGDGDRECVFYGAAIIMRQPLLQ